MFKAEMIAPCGLDCKICAQALIEHDPCQGCNGPDDHKGYAAEALKAVLEYLTVQEGIARVTAWCASDNIASKRTLEKAGIHLKGIDAGGLEVEGQRYDRLDYAYDRNQ